MLILSLSQLQEQDLGEAHWCVQFLFPKPDVKKGSDAYASLTNVY